MKSRWIISEVYLSRVLFFSIFFLVLNMPYLLFSKGIKYDNINDDDKTEYVIRLINGDLLSGTISDKGSDEKGAFLTIRTMVGSPTVYEDEIYEVRLRKEFYRHTSRVFLLPTALPIKNNHFVGNFELGLFIAGIGLGEHLSINLGRSILPFVLPDQQLSMLNVKGSMQAIHFADIPSDIFIGGGVNLAFLNDDNRLIHAFANATYLGNKSSVTAALFYKAGSQDFAQIRMKNEYIDLNYPDGSFGIALGLDTKFANRDDLHFIGEIWNSNINMPTNSAIMIGLRLGGTMFSADFGLAFFTEPFAAPFISFVWTPF